MKQNILWILIIVLCITGGTQSRDAHRDDAAGVMTGSIIRLKNTAFNPIDGVPPVPVYLQAGRGNPVRLMQVPGPMPSAWIEEMKGLGVVFLGYLPDNTYVVYLERDKEEVLRSRREMLWFGDFHPAYKIQSGLLERTGVFEVNMMLFPDLAGRLSRSRVMQAIREAGGEVTYISDVSPVIRAVISADATQRLAALPEVHWIDRYDRPVPCMDHIKKMVGATKSFKGGFSGEGIAGEVKDAGCDYKHPDFADSMVGFDGDPRVDPHGTCTFGIVFGTGRNNMRAIGMMPDGDGIFCNWSVERADSIVNLQNIWGGLFQSNSWSQGDQDGVYSSYSNEDDLCINTYGVSMLYAAGNSGVYPGMITQDAVAKNVFGVGAIFHYNDSDLENDEWVNNSYGNTPGQGPAADNRIKPDICGVFDQIFTTDVRGEDGYDDEDYTEDFGGTSGATPIVAGVVGLTYEMYIKNYFGNNPGGAVPDNATVKALVINHAYQYDLARASRFQQGWGLADIGRIYNVGSQQVIVNGTAPVETGQILNYTIQKLPGDDPLKISLVWDDPPAMPAASKALVNDIDLKVIAPDGHFYHGNIGLSGSHASSPGGNADRKNNVENVFLNNTFPGDYLIQVAGYDIAADNHDDPGVNQKFSLVASRAVQTSSDREPFLYDQAFTPDSGFKGQLFEFTLNYLDADGDTPQVLNLVLNDVVYPMSLASGSAADGTYTLATRALENGSTNRYYFYAEDATGRTKRFPLTGVFSGPTVYNPLIFVSGDAVPGGNMRVEIYGAPKARWACAWSSEDGPWDHPAMNLTLDIGPGDVHVVKNITQAPLRLNDNGFGVKNFTLPGDATLGKKYIQAVTMYSGVWAKSNAPSFTITD
jgi:hypothetical protein